MIIIIINTFWQLIFHESGVREKNLMKNWNEIEEKFKFIDKMMLENTIYGV